MKRLLLLSSALLSVALATAATGPIRVLYFDAQGTEQTVLGPLHGAMRDLGRDALWFDYATGPTPGAADLARYDVLVLRPKVDGSPALNNAISLPSGGSVSGLVKSRVCHQARGSTGS